MTSVPPVRGASRRSETRASANRTRFAVTSDSLATALARLLSLRDGDRGVAEAASHGADAIPALRAVLFEREPSGLFETRRRAVEALALIGAHDVLIEFLESQHEAADPVERLGDDAIVNAAARALSGVGWPRVFHLLMSLAEKRSWPGVVAALGAFRRAESIPYLVAALAEDESRPSAEAALLALGAAACDALVAAARRRPFDLDSESRLRQRRSALALLLQIGVKPHEWPRLREVMQDRDPKAEQLACRICLACAPESERREAIARLKRLMLTASMTERMDIQRSLADSVRTRT
jgi:hypothetical protein